MKDMSYQSFSEKDGQASYAFARSLSSTQNVLSLPLLILRQAAE